MKKPNTPNPMIKHSPSHSDDLLEIRSIHPPNFVKPINLLSREHSPDTAGK
ncbi:hypothetical protein THOA03_190003 [Vibrio owensii]|nr:hypothetical protein THOA03_190003 [Vibrio owensii]